MTYENPTEAETAAINFFYENAGYSYNPKTETKEAGRERCAIELAEAETEAARYGYAFVWDVDQDIDSSEFRDDCEPYATYNCTAYDSDGGIAASVCGCDFGPEGYKPGDSYARVVQAELAAEIFA